MGCTATDGPVRCSKGTLAPDVGDAGSPCTFRLPPDVAAFAEVHPDGLQLSRGTGPDVQNDAVVPSLADCSMLAGTDLFGWYFAWGMAGNFSSVASDSIRLCPEACATQVGDAGGNLVLSYLVGRCGCPGQGICPLGGR
jgi:hypothetical protein